MDVFGWAVGLVGRINFSCKPRLHSTQLGVANGALNTVRYFPLPLYPIFFRCYPPFLSFLWLWKSWFLLCSFIHFSFFTSIWITFSHFRALLIMSCRVHRRLEFTSACLVVVFMCFSLASARVVRSKLGPVSRTTPASSTCIFPSSHEAESFVTW